MPASDSTTRRQRLVLLLLGGSVLFTDPFLHIINRPVDVLGIPLLHGMLLLIWGVLVGAVALSMRHDRRQARDRPPEPANGRGTLPPPSSVSS